MNFSFPSREFDEVVAAVCHGAPTDEQARALNELLHNDPSARDEYILRLELHSRLASEPDLYLTADLGLSDAGASACQIERPLSALPLPTAESTRGRTLRWALVAAAAALVVAGLWSRQAWRSGENMGATSNAVAMLNRVVDARWGQQSAAPRLGAPLEAGWIRIESGLAQIVFYSGARVAIEGPTDLEIISPSEASCRSGRLTAEVPAQAHGFRINTPQGEVTDLGTTFGLEVRENATELHVFQGSVRVRLAGKRSVDDLLEGAGAVLEHAGSPRLIAADPSAFASLADLQAKSTAATDLHYDRWRAANRRLNLDPSLRVHLDFEHSNPSDWRLPNVSGGHAEADDAVIVGCQWTQGRWPAKSAVEFRSVNDRIRLSVPGKLDALTLSAWVRVQGLDRKFNSLFMCEGFHPGTIHWLIRNDGVLGLTVIGQSHRDFQVIPSPPAVTLDQFGMWLHLAVVLDGNLNRVKHYVNGSQVSESPLHISPPFRIGAAELGNWNSSGHPGRDSLLIRNFSGAMDEFCLFDRALKDGEIRKLFSNGVPVDDAAPRS